MIQIREATSERDLDTVRALVHAYIDWLKQLYPDAQDSVNQYFELIEEELASLPGKFGPPTGKLLVAHYDGEGAGTVAMHELGNQICEMKRMFVYAKFHGKGVGRALAARIMSDAAKLGYSHMRLETSLGQVAARGLYRSMGFQEIGAYYEVPERLRANMLFMEREL